MRVLTLSILIGAWLAVFGSHGNASNLINNPDFTEGNSSFITGYTESSDLSDPSTFAIGSDPSQYNSNWLSTIRPHTGSAMMIVNAATNPDTIVWQNTPVKVKPHTTYYFGVYATSLFETSPPVLVFRINGVLVGDDDSLRLPPGQWTQFYVAWNSGTSTTAIISIVDDNTDAYGNDFAIDNISFDTSFFTVSEHQTILAVRSWMSDRINGDINQSESLVILGMGMAILGMGLAVVGYGMLRLATNRKQ